MNNPAPRRQAPLSNPPARQHWHDYWPPIWWKDEQREIAKPKPLLAEVDRQLDGLIVVLNQQNPATLNDYLQDWNVPATRCKARWIGWWKCNWKSPRQNTSISVARCITPASATA
ncbi:MAG: hypothetical protein U1E47_09020 [Rivihabitans pingtungensis]